MLRAEACGLQGSARKIMLLPAWSRRNISQDVAYGAAREGQSVRGSVFLYAAMASAFCRAVCRLTALSTARNDEVTMSPCMPTPKPVGESPTRNSI